MRFLSAAALLLAAAVYAGPGLSTPQDATGRKARIVTTDGTQVIGELKGLQDGKYVIVSDTIGEVTIEDGKVKSITYVETDAQPDTDAPAPAPAVDGQLSAEQINTAVETYGRQIVTNQETMGMLEKLMDDPEILELFMDEDFVKQAQEGDFVKLMQNEKLQHVADNSVAMRRLVDTILGRDLRDPADPAKQPAAAAPAPAADAIDAADAALAE